MMRVSAATSEKMCIRDRYRGITAVRAVNGQVCIDILKHAEPGTFDAVLMDIQMPVMLSLIHI